MGGIQKEIPEEEQYLLESLQYIQTKLLNLRYNVKEIKACMNVATENKNNNRIKTLQEQKGKTNGLIKACLEDQKLTLSIYKKVKVVGSK